MNYTVAEFGEVVGRGKTVYLDMRTTHPSGSARDRKIWPPASESTRKELIEETKIVLSYFPITLTEAKDEADLVLIIHGKLEVWGGTIEKWSWKTGKRTYYRSWTNARFGKGRLELQTPDGQKLYSRPLFYVVRLDRFDPVKEVLHIYRNTLLECFATAYGTNPVINILLENSESNTTAVLHSTVRHRVEVVRILSLDLAALHYLAKVRERRACVPILERWKAVPIDKRWKGKVFPPGVPDYGGALVEITGHKPEQEDNSPEYWEAWLKEHSEFDQ